MASLSYAELIRAVAESSESSRWESGVPADVSLYVTFKAAEHVESETLEAADGSLLVIDRDADGLVCGFEIT